MKVDDVQQLSVWLAATDIQLLELRGPDHHVCLRRDGAKFVLVAHDDVQDDRAPPIVVTAASVGVFLDGHPLRKEALAAPGAVMRAGQVMGLLQIGALLLPVTAPQDGIVERTLVAHGATVGFGTPLLELRTL